METQTVPLSRIPDQAINSLTKSADSVFLYLGIASSLLLGISSIGGLFFKNLYAMETPYWQAQALAQDFFDVVIICPLLIVSGIYATKNNRVFPFIFCGTNLFVVYTFVIYCFTVHFNQFFIIYCIVLGLGVYSFVYSLFRLSRRRSDRWFLNNVPKKSVAIFIILVAVAFYALWLKEIMPATINNTIPETLIQSGLVTNPVHILDLAIILPGIIIVAVLLLNGKPLGIIIAPVVLTFFVLMNISIAALMVYLARNVKGNDFTPTIILSILAILSLVFLIKMLRQLKEPICRIPNKLNHII